MVSPRCRSQRATSKPPQLLRKRTTRTATSGTGRRPLIGDSSRRDDETVRPGHPLKVSDNAEIPLLEDLRIGDFGSSGKPSIDFTGTSSASVPQRAISSGNQQLGPVDRPALERDIGGTRQHLDYVKRDHSRALPPWRGS